MDLAMNTRQNEIDTLTILMKQTKDKRMFERYQAIQLHLQGYLQKDIVNIVGRSRKTIYCYISAYEEKGIEGLVRNASPGAPRKLTATQEQALVQVITTKLPVDVGFPAKFNWTLAIVAAFIEREWHKTYTLRGVSILLHDLGLSHTKPTYTLANADPVKQKQFIEETFPALKKTDVRGN